MKPKAANPSRMHGRPHPLGAWCPDRVLRRVRGDRRGCDARKQDLPETRRCAVEWPIELLNRWAHLAVHEGSTICARPFFGQICESVGDALVCWAPAINFGLRRTNPCHVRSSTITYGLQTMLNRASRECQILWFRRVADLETECRFHPKGAAVLWPFSSTKRYKVQFATT